MIPSHLLPIAEAFLPHNLFQELHTSGPEAAIGASYARLEAVHAAIVPFVPSPVLRVLADNRANKRVIGSQLRGTLIFARFVGYADLLHQYSQRGRQGNEAASDFLQIVFGALADAVTTYGGGLLKLGGDSVTAVFEQKSLGSQHAALAIAAALQMQHALSSTDVADSSTRLQLRLAVHTGSFFMAEVGDNTHRELLLTGAATNKIAQLCDTAPIGHVVATPETAALIQAQTTLQRDGSRIVTKLVQTPKRPVVAALWEPSAPSAAALNELLERIARLQPFLPQDLPQRFLQQNITVGEFRPVTLVVSSFHGFRRLLDFLEMAATVEGDVSIIGELLDIYFTEIQSTLQRYGGSISTIEMAASGDRMIVLFGAPKTHEDDPERAVKAMLALRAHGTLLQQRVLGLLRSWTAAHPEHLMLLRLASALPRQRTGIATGTVFAGVLGSRERRGYNVIGETLSVAERLMLAADEGGVFVASRTKELVPRLVAEPLLPLLLQDFAQPVPMFRAMKIATASSALVDTSIAAPLVGRAHAITSLNQQANEALGNDQARIVSIVGEPGIGKTRLVDELWQQLVETHPKAWLFRDACQSYEQTTPYALVSRVLNRMLPLDPRDDRETHIAYVQAQFDGLVPDWSRFTPLVGPLLNLALPETDLTTALSSEQRHDRLHDLVVAALLGLAKQQPVALALDDLHWIDPSSAAVLEQVALELGNEPLLLVLGYRPTPNLAVSWQNQPNHTRLELEQLDEAARAALLAELLGAEPPPELLPLLQRTQGIPLFLEEMVRYLLNAQIVQQQHGTWTISKPIEDAIPLEIEQLIVARLDRLQEATREVAQTASIIGEQFDEELIRALFDGEWHEQKEELHHADVIVQLDAATYGFKHHLVCNVIYESMAFARRRELHATVAATMEQVYAAELGPHRVVLAQHYLRAEQHNRAFPHFLHAAQEAQARFANQEAISLYTQALYAAPWYRDDQVAADLALAAPLYEGLGDALALTGSYSSAREYYGALIEMIDAQNATNLHVLKAALQRKIGSTLEHQGNFHTALQRLHTAAATIQNAAPDEATVEYARILSDTGWVYFRQNDLAQAQLYLEQALNQLEEEAVTPETARIYNRLGGIAWQQGDLATAQRYVEQSLKASEEAGDLVGQASALNNLGILAEQQALLATAIDYGLHAIKLYERVGQRRELSMTTNNVGWILYSQGDLQEAYRYFELALKDALKIRDSINQIRIYHNLGHVFFGLKQLDLSKGFFENSLSIALQLRLAEEQLDNYVAIAEVALQEENLEKSMQNYDHALSLVTSRESESYGRLQRLQARLAFIQGYKPHAIELLQMNELLFTRLQNVPETNRTRKLLAEMEDK